MLLRSAFWLTVGFMVMAPHDTDFGAAATSLKDQAVAAGLKAGENLLVSQVLGKSPAAGAVLETLSSSSFPSAGDPMHASPAGSFVFPRHRPAAMG
jgi:hypothetical protein